MNETEQKINGTRRAAPPPGHPTLPFGPLVGEPIDTRRFRPVRIFERRASEFVVGDFLYRGQYGSLRVDTDAVGRIEILGTTSGESRCARLLRRSGSGSEAPALHHTAILYHLDRPAVFTVKEPWQPDQGESLEVHDVVSAGNAVGPPGLSFSPGNSARRVLALVLRLMTLDDFVFEEGYVLRHRVRRLPVTFRDATQLRDVLSLAIEYSDQNAHSVEYKWMTGPNCHAWTREIIDPVAGYDGPLTHVGPLDIPTYAETRGILDPDHPAMRDVLADRRDATYREIGKQHKARIHAPENAWARAYRHPRIRGREGTVLGGLLAIAARGKFNPSRAAGRALRKRYGRSGPEVGAEAAPRREGQNP